MSSNGSPYDEVSPAQATINRINSFLAEQERDEKLRKKSVVNGIMMKEADKQ